MKHLKLERQLAPSNWLGVSNEPVCVHLGLMSVEYLQGPDDEVQRACVNKLLGVGDISDPPQRPLCFSLTRFLSELGHFSDGWKVS